MISVSSEDQSLTCMKRILTDAKKWHSLLIHRLVQHSYDQAFNALSHECRISLRMRNECIFFNPLKCDSCPFYPLNGRSSSSYVRCYTCYFFLSDTLKITRSSYTHAALVWQGFEGPVRRVPHSQMH